MENPASVGASGIVYAYVPIALYIIVKALKEKKNYNQVLTYVYVVTIIVIYIVITCVASFSATNLWHLIATVIGITFLFIYKKSIHREFSEKISGNNTTKIKMNKALLGLIIIPLLMIGILIAYKYQIIQIPFIIN
mgnify:CR=1 FL=1